MESVLIEIIRTIFICAILLVTAWALRPVIRFLRTPMPRLEKFDMTQILEEVDEEIQIPNASGSESYDQSKILMTAGKSPQMTAQTIRQWLKEPSNPSPHA